MLCRCPKLHFYATNAKLKSKQSCIHHASIPRTSSTVSSKAPWSFSMFCIQEACRQSKPSFCSCLVWGARPSPTEGPRRSVRDLMSESRRPPSKPPKHGTVSCPFRARPSLEVSVGRSFAQHEHEQLKPLSLALRCSKSAVDRNRELPHRGHCKCHLEKRLWQACKMVQA